MRTPEGLTAEHLDIIKLTAQCVARNGQSFLTGAPHYSDFCEYLVDVTSAYSAKPMQYTCLESSHTEKVYKELQMLLHHIGIKKARRAGIETQA